MTTKRPGAVHDTPVSQAKKRCNTGLSQIATFFVDLNDCNVLQVNSDLAKFSHFPKCYLSAGYILDVFIGSTKSYKDLVKNFNMSFPCFVEQFCPKSLVRVVTQASNLLKSCPQTANILIKNWRINKDAKGMYEHQHSSLRFIKGETCLVCRVPPDNYDLKLDGFLDMFYNEQIALGDSVQNVHDKIVRANVIIANKFNARSSSNIKSVIHYPVSQEHQNELTKAKNLAQDWESRCKSFLESITRGLKEYEEHLKTHSAFIRYALRISDKEINRLDSIAFTYKAPTPELTAVISKLPKVDHIKPLEVHDDIFNEYIDNVRKSKSEPIFSEIAKKFDLRGAEGGHSGPQLSRYAQSICYNKLLKYESENPEIFNKEIKPVLIASLCREDRKKFKIFSDVEKSLTIPNLPTKKEADKIIANMVQKGEIILGQAQPPIPLETYNSYLQCEQTVYAHSRKTELAKLRQHLLDIHTAKGYMRAQKDSYYRTLNRENCLKILESYYVYFESTEKKISDLKELQDFVKDVETTRHFLIWWDHAEIANYTYVLFNFQLIYNPAVYHSEAHSGRELQKIIETPELYFIGLGRSTYESEESYSKMRVDDLVSLSTKFSDVNGICFRDVYKFTTGDTPARCSESGQQKGGHYPIATLPLHIKNFSSFHALCSVTHMTIEEQRNHANKGGYYYDEEAKTTRNLGKSLLDEKNAKDIARLRLNLRNNEITQGEAVDKLKYDLHGRRHQHTLLINSPYKDLTELNIERLEVFPCEPLHDLKGLCKKAFEHLPGSIKCNTANSEVVSIVKKIISGHDDKLYLLKDNHSAETIFKFLINITLDLEQKLFPHGLGEGCSTCGPIFTLTDKQKCEKCLFVGYYRLLLEIHIFAYKDDSKRNGQAVLRLYNLVFLFFYFTKSLLENFQDSKIDKLIHTVYFTNVVYYLPICFQLLCSLSFNAGRHEGDFQDYKSVINNYSNKQHFSPFLLLNAEKRLAIQKHYRETKHTKSQVSKHIDRFLKVSPFLDLAFCSSYINSSVDTMKDFLGHLKRISVFLVSNDVNQYMVASSEEKSLTFPVLSCDCIVVSNSCKSCKSTMFPPYPIHNVYNSSVDKIIKVNASIFDQILSRSELIDTEKSIISFSNLANLVDKKYNINCINNMCSKNIIKSVKTSNTLAPYILALKDKPLRYSELKHSISVQCLALIYGTVDDDLLMFDKTCYNVNHYQNLCNHDSHKLKYNEHYQGHFSQYIRHVRRHIRKLESLESSIICRIEQTSHLVDGMTSEDIDEKEFYDLCCVKELKNLQHKRLAMVNLLCNFKHESDAHRYIMDIIV